MGMNGVNLNALLSVNFLKREIIGVPKVIQEKTIGFNIFSTKQGIISSF